MINVMTIKSGTENELLIFLKKMSDITSLYNI